MTTKGYGLCLKEKQKIYADDTSNTQYNKLNLNQKSKCVFKETFRSKTVTVESRKAQNYGFDNIQTRKDSSTSRNKSIKLFSSNCLNTFRDSGEKDELKKPNSANSSTLSLHIEVYENFVETKKELNGNEKEDNESEKSDFTRKLQITKQIFIGSPSLIQNHFEFPRQQEDQTDQPELMQFKASQRLLNPNHLAATADAEPSSTSAEVVADIKPVIVKVQENEEELEEIDIMGTSDNEEAAQMSSSNGSVGRNENRNKQVSFVHPSVASSSSSSRMHPPTRVAIPIKTRITKKTAKTKTKYVRDANKRDMTFNTQDYNYMEDELFFKKEEIPLPFEDVRLYEHGLEQRPLGEQRYVVDAIANAFAILQQEARKIQGQLRALNARSGRIRKQIDREEEAIARGEDPTEVPRSSKGLLEGEMMIPVKPAPTSWCNNRRKKKVIRRRPQATNNGAGFGHDEENSDYE